VETEGDDASFLAVVEKNRVVDRVPIVNNVEDKIFRNHVGRRGSFKIQKLLFHLWSLVNSGLYKHTESSQ